MPFKKHMLLAYEPEQFTALNADALTYILTVRDVRWWGLIDRVVKVEARVPFHVNAREFYEPKLNVWNK